MSTETHTNAPSKDDLLKLINSSSKHQNIKKLAEKIVQYAFKLIKKADSPSYVDRGLRFMKSCFPKDPYALEDTPKAQMYSLYARRCLALTKDLFEAKVPINQTIYSYIKLADNIKGKPSKELKEFANLLLTFAGFFMLVAIVSIIILSTTNPALLPAAAMAFGGLLSLPSAASLGMHALASRAGISKKMVELADTLQMNEDSSAAKLSS